MVNRQQHQQTGILVPLYCLVLGFAPKRAIPLSNVTILVGCLI